MYSSVLFSLGRRRVLRREVSDVEEEALAAGWVEGKGAARFRA
jgi:hypothetical protein